MTLANLSWTAARGRPSIYWLERSTLVSTLLTLDGKCVIFNINLTMNPPLSFKLKEGRLMALYLSK